MWRPSRSGGAILALALFGCAVSTRAADEPRPRAGRYRVGPLFLTPKLDLKNLGVDTNVFADESTRVSDTIIDLSPSLTIAPAGRRLRVSGLASLDFNHFVEQASERSTDHFVTGRIERDIGPATLIGGAGEGRFRERFAFEEEERIARGETHAFVGLAIRPTSRVSGSVHGTRRVYDFRGGSPQATSIKQTLDRTSYLVNVETRYKLTRATSLVASWDSFDDHFANPLGSAPPTVSSSRLMGGFDFGPKAIVNGRLLAGTRRFPAGGGVAPYNGLALAANIGAPLRSARLVGYADRDVLYAVNRAGTPEDQRRNTYVWTRLRGELTVELPAQLIGRGFLNREQARFLLPFVVDGNATVRTDRFWTLGGAIERRISDGLRVGLTLDWERRTSALRASSYGRARYGIQGSWTP